mmetsp:Transcript_110464/g.195460  ORF Transcript_110464/g.195460 Transcript_110464/m.195460 type:complete len:203 (-) Transcript_110464:1959-2567(-)
MDSSPRTDLFLLPWETHALLEQKGFHSPAQQACCQIWQLLRPQLLCCPESASTCSARQRHRWAQLLQLWQLPQPLVPAARQQPRLLGPRAAPVATRSCWARPGPKRRHPCWEHPASRKSLPTSRSCEVWIPSWTLQRCQHLTPPSEWRPHRPAPVYPETVALHHWYHPHCETRQVRQQQWRERRSQHQSPDAAAQLSTPGAP